MTYELAKQLKDAGFPQTDDEQRILNDPKTGMAFAYVPNLEELIEACGGNLNGIINKKGIWLATGGNHIGFYGDDFVEQGSTPTEAVARLWLALNK